jgi:dephospho-CoA kinase
MRRILLTGMSGSGKSTVVAALAARGYRAVDVDDGWTEPLPDGRQRWREAAIEALLADERWPVLFIAGCEENQARFYPRFDQIVLLSAPCATIIERLATRTTNNFGKHPDELRRILDDLHQVEPLLRAVAHHEIDTTAPLADVVAAIERLAAG